jgi:F-type H+-transporting ATPase subunit a
MGHIAPEVLFGIFGFGVTNTIVTTLLTDAILLLLLFFIIKNIKVVPKKLQNIAEIGISTGYNFTEQISGKYTKSIFPWFASFFIFIFAANFIGLFPGFGSIGFFHEATSHAETSDENTSSHEESVATNETADSHTPESETNASPAETSPSETSKTSDTHTEKELTPLFRAVTSDFNATFALATISIVTTHFLSIKYNGIKNYLSRFFSLNPIFLFVGILELISEATKLFSLSFRLFGNIYAGEVVLHTISDIFAFIAPIPFLLLESIVAVVQALVFSLLTMVFMSILVSPAHSEGGEH